MASFEWPADKKLYDTVQRIGRGAFSGVWKAKCKSNRQEVAIKIMDLEKISTSFEDILQEVQTMRLSDDPNVLRCYCSFVHEDQLWLVTQLMNKGSCLRVMNIARKMGFGDGLNEEWIGYILRETLQGLNYLHSNGQIHRDIKSGNILLTDDGSVRLADFGVAGWTMAKGVRHETCRTFVGTPCWMAPEVMEQLEGYDLRADIWSIGITALELAKGYAPYARYAPMRVLVLTIEEDPPSLRTYEGNSEKQRTGAAFSKVFEDFYKKCLQKNPKNRPTTEDLLKHKLFKDAGRARAGFVSQLLNRIPPVGEEDAIDSLDRTPPVIAHPHDRTSRNFSSGGQTVHNMLSPGGNREYVAGTTWVFEGSDPGSSPAVSREEGYFSEVVRENSNKVVKMQSDSSASLDSFMEEFEQQTGAIRNASHMSPSRTNQSMEPVGAGESLEESSLQTPHKYHNNLPVLLETGIDNGGDSPSMKRFQPNLFTNATDGSDTAAFLDEFDEMVAGGKV